MVLDSWLDSVYSDDSWKRFHLASCGRPASASHQNQRAHRFTCSGGFLCWALVVPSLFFCRRGSNWPRPYASLADFVTWLFRYGSIINLCSLALDRYMAVLRTKTNALIVSLSVADFCVGAFVVPSLFSCHIRGGCNWPRPYAS
ncbi:unnamed protein product [Porites lobata]|uniref:G-protein coupled receptors family 1 profile domain-containing protein n=1 Tax=Porites lobata TaxID=104759 RepID=A0ABN8MXL4_9CNID|nr:unnamed protein product [Porites lobata]